MARGIMIQGTCSGAGKSLIAAGFCRIFQQDGYKVAPFKSQNMALNSYITKDGLEMGRAQVVQAEAAKIEPSVYMNPILLKPTGDTASQVIVNGEVMKNMTAKEYYKNKKVLVPEIEKAYKKLDEEFDIIVIEGAGSPAEINLKANDIVNMFIAKLTDSPVILTGDIDRGGVFASLVGTMSLLDDDEKSRVKGLLINKFRGDLSILEPGLKTIEEMTGVRVVGTVPYMDVDIDDEDSLSERLTENKKVAPVEIAVIRTPRISNFTDFNVFEYMSQVSVVYVDRKEKLGNPDMIILPGTKNTIGDLLWLRESGLEGAIKKKAEGGTPVFGICGGYQLLGMSLSDPYCMEKGGTARGMELLPVSTVFARKKHTRQTEGTFQNLEGIFSCLNGMKFRGYEIHMGDTEPETASLGNHLTDTGDGWNIADVYGSYVHGIFDEEGIADAVVHALMERKGMTPEEIAGAGEGINLAEYKETQYDRLADGIRNAVDMDYIYQVMGVSGHKTETEV